MRIADGIAINEKPQLSDPISLRLPADILASIEAIADATEHPRSWVIVRAPRFYLAGEGAELLEIIVGKAQIASGDMHDMGVVLGEVEQIIRGDDGKAA